MTRSTTHEDAVIIIGAGVFGLSTALELSKRGYKNVTVLDRHPAPVPDGSSVDISRLLRIDYADPIYAAIANEAVKQWRTKYREFYREIGFIMSADVPRHEYIEKCKGVLRAMKRDFIDIDADKRVHVPHNVTDLTGLTGFFNPNAGWADASAVVKHLAQECSMAGVSFITGPRGTVTSLLTTKSGGRGGINGVKVQSGDVVRTSRVILAAGAWSSRLVDMSGRAMSTSQPVGFIQLSKSEADEMRNHPMVMNLTTGIYFFPPNSDNILKVGQHGFGFETRFATNWVDDNDSGSGGGINSKESTSLTSAPPSQYSGGRYLPSDAESVLRNGLQRMLPQFADRPWIQNRFCWYTDTPHGDFIVDNHPDIEGLFISTGGSGHGFKFLPVLGRYVVDCLEGRASQELREKWAFKKRENLHEMKGDGSRGGLARRVLSVQEQAKL